MYNQVGSLKERLWKSRKRTVRQKRKLKSAEIGTISFEIENHTGFSQNINNRHNRVKEWR